jgi:AcrR family transcriptional regulator
MGRSWALPADSERERVLLATAELWGKRGYDGLSVASICDQAGVEEASFAAMFRDVEAAAKATVEVPLAAVVEVVSGLYSPDRSEAESYAMAIVGLLRLMAANPAYADVAYITGRQMAPPGVHALYETGHQVLVAMLERLWEGSTLSDKPARAGLGALGAAEAVVRRELVAGRYERLPDLAPDFVYAATVPFLGIAEAQRLAQVARGHSRRGSGAR